MTGVDPNAPPPPAPASPPPAPAAQPANSLLSKLSQGELLVGAGALILVVGDLIFGLVTRDYSLGQLPWAVALVALVAILLHLRGMNLPVSYEGILVLAGLTIALIGVRDLLYDLRYLSGNQVDVTYYLGMLAYYLGVVLMAVGAWMVWRRRPA